MAISWDKMGTTGNRDGPKSKPDKTSPSGRLHSVDKAGLGPIHIQTNEMILGPTSRKVPIEERMLVTGLGGLWSMVGRHDVRKFSSRVERKL